MKDFVQTHFLKSITATIQDFSMLESGDSVLVAVSGGPDSVALLLALLHLRETFGITLGVAHLNHKLRGEDAAQDEIFAHALARKHGLPFFAEQADVRRFAARQKLSVEEAGREIRYEFFSRAAHGHGYRKIATGHTRNDNAEQVLMNLLRGSGPKGLTGIPPVRNKVYIRPLIHVLKQDILSFLAHENQGYQVDETNTDMAYLRNRVRHRLIPHLETEFNPGILDSLDRLSRILSREEAYLEIETEKQFTHCLAHMDERTVTFSRPRLSELHPALLNRILRKAIFTVKKNLKQISAGHLENLAAFCFDSSPGSSLDLPGQIRLYKNREQITVKKESQPLRQIGKKQKHLRRLSQSPQR